MGRIPAEDMDVASAVSSTHHLDGMVHGTWLGDLEDCGASVSRRHGEGRHPRAAAEEVVDLKPPPRHGGPEHGGEVVDSAGDVTVGGLGLPAPLGDSELYRVDRHPRRVAMSPLTAQPSAAYTHAAPPAEPLPAQHCPPGLSPA